MLDEIDVDGGTGEVMEGATLTQARTMLRSNELAVEAERRSKAVLESQELQLVADLHAKEAALTVAIEDVRPRLVRGSADRLPFPDAAFDVVLCVNTIHNLPLDRCKQAIRELERVKKPGGHGYLQVDSWLNEQQHQDFLNWQLTAQTYFAPEEWRTLFAGCGYSGDYYWTLAE